MSAWTPNILLCPDPDTCAEDHNEVDTWDVPHHYGCECEDCIEYYRRLKS